MSQTMFNIPSRERIRELVDLDAQKRLEAEKVATQPAPAPVPEAEQPLVPGLEPKIKTLSEVRPGYAFLGRKLSEAATAMGPVVGNIGGRIAAGGEQKLFQAFAENRSNANKSFSEIFNERIQGPEDGGINWAASLQAMGAVGAYLNSRYLAATESPDANAAKAQEYQLRAADAAVERSQIPMSETSQAFGADYYSRPTREGFFLGMGSSVKNFFEAATQNPSGAAAFLLETSAESAPLMGLAITATALTKSPQVGAAFMGLGSATMERYTGPLDYLVSKGIDLNNPVQLRAAIGDKELMAEAANYGLTRAAIIGFVDWVAGVSAASELYKSPLANFAAQGVTQAGLGGISETGAQAATKGPSNIDWNDVTLEALAEFTTAPIEVIGIGRQYLDSKKGVTKTSLEDILADAARGDRGAMDLLQSYGFSSDEITRMVNQRKAGVEDDAEPEPPVEIDPDLDAKLAEVLGDDLADAPTADPPFPDVPENPMPRGADMGDPNFPLATDMGGTATGQMVAENRVSVQDVGFAGLPQLIREIAEAAPPPPRDQIPDATAASQAPPSPGKSAGLFLFNATSLGVDAERFQFKDGGDQEGVTNRLKGVKRWDPAKANQLMVWQSAEGDLFVVDGHQRSGLARRLVEQGLEQEIKIPGLLYRETDGFTPEKMRALAAGKNLAEGSGTLLDAAKVLKVDPELIDDSMPVSDYKIRQANDLAKLGDEPFRMVINEVTDPEYGAIVGRLIPDSSDQQIAAISALNKIGPANAVEAELIVRRVLNSQMAEAADQGPGLFGDMLDTPESTVVEEIKIVARAMAELKKDKAVFSRVVKNADQIESAGSQINREASAGVVSESDRAIILLTTQSDTAGPVRTQLLELARDLKQGKIAAAAAARKLAETIRSQPVFKARGDEPQLAAMRPKRKAPIDTGTLDLFAQGQQVAAQEAAQNVRRKAEQLTLDGMGPSARQLAASREAAGQGRLRAGRDQADANQGLFADKPDDGGFEFMVPKADLRADQTPFDTREAKSGYLDLFAANPEAKATVTEARVRISEMLQAGASLDEVAADPAVVNLTRLMISLPASDLTPRDILALDANGRQINSEAELNAAYDDVARKLAWVDDKLPFPENALKFDRVATIILGPPAAGKSTIANPVARSKGAAILDSDEAKKFIPGFNGGIGANAVHDESSAMAKSQLKRLSETGVNIVIPKVGDKAAGIQELVGLLNSYGYSVEVINVRVSAENAATRSLGRFIKTGRFIPIDLMKRVGERPSDTYIELRDRGVVQRYAEIEGNGGPQEPKPILEDNAGSLDGVEAEGLPVIRGNNRPVGRDGQQADQILAGASQGQGQGDGSDRVRQGSPPQNPAAGAARDDRGEGENRLAAFNSSVEETLDAPQPPGTSILVYRLGRENSQTLAGSNAGNSAGVAAHLAMVDDFDMPAQVGGTGDTVHVFRVTVDQNYGAYEAATKSRGATRETVGRRGRYGGVWYSFGQSGYSQEYLGSVSLNEVRAAVREQGFENFDDTGAAKGGDIIREVVARKFETDTESLIPRQPGVTLAGEPTRPAQGVADTGQADPAQMSLSEMSNNLVRLMGLVFRTGRVTAGRDALAQYRARDGVIRARQRNDFSALVHESFHFLNDIRAAELTTIITRHQAELQGITFRHYGNPAGLNARGVMREGFAEFGRFFITNPLLAKIEAPGFFADFDALLQSVDPKMHQGFMLLRQQVQRYAQQHPSTEVVKGFLTPAKRKSLWNPSDAAEIIAEGARAERPETNQVTAGGVIDWVRRGMFEMSSRVYAGLVDQNNAMKKLVYKIQNVAAENKKSVDVLDSENPYELLTKSSRSFMPAQIQLQYGIRPYGGSQSVGPSLRDAIAVAMGATGQDSFFQMDETRMEDFNAYLATRRIRWEYGRFNRGEIPNPPAGVTEGDARQAIQDFERKYGAAFLRAADMIYEFNRNLLDKEFEAGLMDQETYDLIKDYDDYVPLARDMSDRNQNFGDNVVTSPKSAIIKRFRGSSRDIINPLDAIMQRVFSTEKRIAENDTVRSLARLARSASDKTGNRAAVGGLVEEVPARKMELIKVKMDAVIRRIIDDPTISLADRWVMESILQSAYTGDEAMNVFRSVMETERGERIMFYRDEGKLKAIQLGDDTIGEDVFNLMKGLGHEKVPLLTEIIAMPSDLLRIGVTKAPAFLLKNYIRDQMGAWVNTNVGFVPFLTGAQGMRAVVTRSKAYQDYSAMMGMMGGMSDLKLHETRIEQDIEGLRQKGYVVETFNWDGLSLRSLSGLTKILPGIGRAVELAEAGTRVGIFKKAYDRAIRDGLSEHDAMHEASRIATDYINYGRKGSKMATATRIIPFLNASIQGLDVHLRKMGGDKATGRLAMKFMEEGRYFPRVQALMRTLPAFTQGSRKKLNLSRTELNDLRNSQAMWLKITAIALFTAALTMAYKDDEDYEETSDYLRRTGWIIPLPFGGIFYIPKPLDLVPYLSAVERGIEYAYGDEAAGERFMNDLIEGWMPPILPPAINVGVGAFTNQGVAQGDGLTKLLETREIVPDYLLRLPPEQQVTDRTSETAKAIGEAMGWSPVKIDYMINSLFGTLGKDVSKSLDAIVNPHRPEMGWDDTFTISTFVRDSTRGGVSGEAFNELANRTSGTLTQAGNGYRRYVDLGDEQGAAEYLANLENDDQRAWAILNGHFEAKHKRLHPVYRANLISQTVSGLRREMLANEIRDSQLEGEFIPLSRGQKRHVDDLLADLVRRERRNALVIYGEPGFTDKKLLDVQTSIDLLRDVAPAAADELEARFEKAKVYNSEAISENWPELKQRLLTDGAEAVLDDLLP